MFLFTQLISITAVIIRGLDGLTTEQSLLDALALVTSLEPKNCYVMRNFSTGVSLGCVSYSYYILSVASCWLFKYVLDCVCAVIV